MSVKIRAHSKSPLYKKAKRGFRGYPVASICFYGATADRASRVAVGITKREKAEVDPLERWYSETSDVRSDVNIGYAILEFIKAQGVKTVIMSDGLLGCRHEEGIDNDQQEAVPTAGSPCRPAWA